MSEPIVERQSPFGTPVENNPPTTAELAQAIKRALEVEGAEREGAEQVVEDLLRRWDTTQHAIPSGFITVLRDQLHLDVGELLGSQQGSGNDALSTSHELSRVQELPQDSTEALTLAIRQWLVTAGSLLKINSLEELNDWEQKNNISLMDLLHHVNSINLQIDTMAAQTFGAAESDTVLRMEQNWIVRSKSRAEKINELLKLKFLQEQKEIATDLILQCEQLISDSGFRPTEEIASADGYTGLQLLLKIKQILKSLSDVQGLDGRLQSLELQFAQRVFDQWKIDLERNHPQLQALREMTASAVATVSSTTPDFSLESSLSDLLENAKSELEAVVSGEKYEDFLNSNYWQPAFKAIGSFKRRKEEIEQEQAGQRAANEQEREFNSLFSELQSEVSTLEIRGYYRIQVFTNNDFKTEFDRIKDRFRNLRSKNRRAEEIAALYQEFIRVSFVVLKATIIKSIESYEFNDDGAGKVDEKNRDLFTPLLSLLESFSNEVQDVGLRGVLEDEYKRFSDEVEVRVSFYLGARSVKNDVLGITDQASSDDIAMQLPSSVPVYMNNYTNELVGRLLRSEIPTCSVPELRSPHIEELSPASEIRKARFYDRIAQQFVVEDVQTTAWAEALAHLDMFFEGRSPNGVSPDLRKKFAKARRELYLMSGADVFEVVDTFEKARLRKVYNADLALARSTPGTLLPQPSDAKYQSKITVKIARRAWNMCMPFMSPLALAPSSFNKPAPGYYALTPDYAMGEIAGSEAGATSDISALIYFSIIGLSYPHLASGENPYGLIHTFDAYEKAVDGNNAGLIKKIAAKTHPSRIRERMKLALEKKDFQEDYSFLVDLPLLPIYPDGVTHDSSAPTGNHLRYRIFTTPLTNMVIRDGRGNAIHYPDASGQPDEDNAIMTFDDLVDLDSISVECPNGRRLYEKMPFGPDNPGDEEIKSWINQAKNIQNFFNQILFAKEPEFAEHAARTVAAGQNKLIKYATNVLQPWALMLREREINGDKLKNQLVLTIMLIQGILMISQGKSVEDVKQNFYKYSVGTSEGREAVITCIEAGFSTSALARNFVKQFAEQIVQSMRLK